MSKTCIALGLPGFNEIMSKRGLKRQFLAERLGIPYKKLWGLVSGAIKHIDPATLRNMADVLGCTTDELLYPPPSSDDGEASQT